MKFNSGNAKSMEELLVIVDHLEGRMAEGGVGSVNFGEPVAMAAEVVCHLVAHMDVIARGKYTAPYVAAALVAAAEVIRDVHTQDAKDEAYFDAVIKAVNRALVSSMSAVAFKMPEVEETEKPAEETEGGDEE